MRWSFALLRVAGTTVRLHVTFLLLLIWFGAVFYLRGGLVGLGLGMVYVLGLFGSVLLHEFGHALAARQFGVRTPVITLLPIGGVARLERIPQEPRQELVVAAAGPAVNLVIAAVLALVGGLAGLDLSPAGVGFFDGHLIGRLLRVNLLLVAFNLLPAFPMDGGRILRALLALRLTYGRATQIAATVGQGMAFLFGFVGLLFNPLLAFIALFVYLGAAAEASSVQLREAVEGLPVASAMLTQFTTVTPATPLREAVEHILHTPQRAFPVVEASDGQRVVGLLTGEDIIKGLKERGPDAGVSAVMQAPPALVHVHSSLADALDRMQARDCRPLLVVSADGRPLGILTCEHVGQFVTLQAAARAAGEMAWRGG